MKTKNVFTLTATTVTMEVYKPVQDKDDILLASLEFDVSAVPAELNDGDNATKSLAAYGLSRLMQDRCSDYTDGKLEQMGLDSQEAANARLGAYKAVYELVQSGEFRARRESAGKQASVDTYFAQALVDYLAENDKEMTITTATAYLQSLTTDERKALRGKLQSYINAARTAAREAVAGLDLGDLMGDE